MSARLGVIGDGQLGGYICRAARRLKVHTTILSNSTDRVADRYSDSVIVASFNDLQAIEQLVGGCDVITFELEDVPVATLHTLATQDRTRVYPAPNTMLLLQNKAMQKDWLMDNGFPTSPHVRFDDGLDASAAVERFGPNFVIKTQRGGYDGLGVRLVKRGDVPDGYQSIPTLAEGMVENFREVAVLVARDGTGRCVHYPVFESTFDGKGNVLRRVVCPAPLTQKQSDEAVGLARDIVSRLEGVGVFAIEFFLADHQLLVNEIAPRVHNVGHLTLEASHVSQFEQHVRAVMGMPLLSASAIHPAAMDNLLYEESLARACTHSVTLSRRNVTVHWYGKQSLRPLRKMGHLTAVSATVEHATRLADEALALLKSA